MQCSAGDAYMGMDLKEDIIYLLDFYPGLFQLHDTEGRFFVN